MNVLITSARRKAVITGLAAVTLTVSIGAAGAQQYYVAPGDQYYGTPAIPDPQIAPSRWDRARFDRWGTRGREGLGATPMQPEGPGNVSN